MRYIKLILCLLLFTLLLSLSAASAPVVRLYVFMSPECSTCEPAKEHSIKEVARKAGCKVELKYFNVDQLSDYRKLVAIEKRIGKTGNEMPVVVCGNRILGGEKEIVSGLLPMLQHYSKTGSDWPDVTVEPLSELPSSQPHAALDKQEINAGNMLQGSEKWLSLTLSNKGRGVLKITGSRSGCPCYKPSVSKRTLAAGDKTQIKIHIKAVGLSGQINKYVMIDTNDPRTPTLRVKVSVNILSVINVSPRNISFGSIKAGTSIEKKLQIKTSGSAIEVVSKSPALKVAYVREVKAGYVAGIRVNGQKPGRLLGKISVVSRKPNCSVDVVVFGNVVP